MIYFSKSLWSRSINFVTVRAKLRQDQISVNVFNSTLEKVIACNAINVIFLPYFGIISPCEYVWLETLRGCRLTVELSLHVELRITVIAAAVNLC